MIMASEIPNEVLDLIFDGMDMKDLASLSITCRAFHKSANKVLYSKVTIRAPVVPLKNKSKHLRNFLKTLLTQPALSLHVQQFTVDFSSPTRCNFRALLAYNGRATIPNIASPDKQLFETRMQNLGFKFDFDCEDRLFIVYNALLALILSQLLNLHSLKLDYAAFPMPAHSESTPPDLSWARLVGRLRLRHLEIRNLLDWHETQSLGLFQSLVSAPTLQKFTAVRYLPSLPHFVDSIISLDITVSAPSTYYTKQGNFEALFRKTRRVKNIILKIPSIDRMSDYGQILCATRNSLTSLTLDYGFSDKDPLDAIMLLYQSRHAPGLFDLSTLGLLTRLDISWDFICATEITTETVRCLPSVLESLTIHHIPVEIFLAEKSPYNRWIRPNDEVRLLQQVLEFGIARQTGRLKNFRNLTLKIDLIERGACDEDRSKWLLSPLRERLLGGESQTNREGAEPSTIGQFGPFNSESYQDRRIMLERSWLQVNGDSFSNTLLTTI